MRPDRIVAVIVMVLAGTAGPALPAAAGSRVLVVDDDGVQCPRASYTDIQPAVDASRIGDTIRVCGGTYRGPVEVDKGVNLVAQLPAVSGTDCAGGGDVPDGSATIVGPVTLSGSGAALEGLVVTGAATGITTGEDSAGYRLRRNVIQANGDFGIDLRSAGGQATVVEANCVRDNGVNGTGGAQAGIVADFGDLVDATIRRNTFTGNVEAISVSGLHRYQNVSIAQNVLRGEGIVVAGVTGSEIRRNDIDSTGSGRPGIAFGGGSVGLTVSGNTVVGGFPGMQFCSSCTNDKHWEPNVGLVITGNTIRASAGTGIATLVPNDEAPIQLARSVIERNSVTGGPASGIALNSSAVGTVLASNTSSGNARGINLAGATGTVVLRNTLTGNSIVDARDTTPDQNTWIGNRCATDDPAGLLCSTSRASGVTGPVTIPAAPPIDHSRWPCLRVSVWDVDPVDGGAWIVVTVVAPDAPAGTFCGA